MNSELLEKLEVVKQLTDLFKFERLVYLGVTIISLLLILISTTSLVLRNAASAAELTMLFGSSGLIAVSTGRLLHMWNETLKRLVPVSKDSENA